MGQSLTTCISSQFCRQWLRYDIAGVIPANTPCGPSGTPLPRILHRRLTREEVGGPGGRLIFVGDVHGCADELEALLQKVKFSSAKDTLFLAGDLVNKGPQSGRVLKLAQKYKAYCVRGNHDDELIEAYYRVGRFQSGLAKYKHDALYQASHSDIRWLQEVPLSLTLPWINVMVVHAGLVPDLPLEKQEFMTLTKVRNLRKSTAGDSAWIPLEDSKGDSSVGWACQWHGPEHVVFGHDAKRRLQEHSFATGLDTGCCYGGQLTAIVADVENFKNRSLH
eukprot:428488-Amphidinium_carterae.1